MTPTGPPEPVAEAAPELLWICGARNEPTPAAGILESPGPAQVTQIVWAYSAVAKAFELAAVVQRNRGRCALDGVVGVAGGADPPAGGPRPRTGDRPVGPSLTSPSTGGTPRLQPGHCLTPGGDLGDSRRGQSTDQDNAGGTPKLFYDEPAPRRRKTFSPELKRELHKAQRGKCMHCGRMPGIDLMDIDHKNPVAKGGSDQKRNLQLLCRSCNTRKGATTDRQFRTKFKPIGVPQTQTPPAKAIPQSKF